MNTSSKKSIISPQDTGIVWYMLDAQQTLRELNTSENGLGPQDVGSCQRS